MRRFLATLAIFLGLLGSTPVPVSAQLSDTSSLSRATAVVLLVEGNAALKARAQWYAGHMPPLPLYSDIEKTWYAPHLEAAFEAGILKVGDSGKFRPGDRITSEEAVELVNRYKERMDASPPTVIALPGKEYSSWFSEALTVAKIYSIKLPERVRIGQPAYRGEFQDMMASVGIQSPELVALTVPSPALQSPYPGTTTTMIAALPIPSPVETPVRAVVTSRPTQTVTRPTQVATQPRPTTTTSRPTQPVAAVQPRPVAQQPVVNRPVVSQPAARPTTTPTQVAAATLPANASAKNFAITMPTLGIKDLTITHPTSPSTSQGLLAPLKYGVGHLFSYPGRNGKILIYGHSSSYAWDVSPFTKIFRKINGLNVGDKIYVTYDGNMHVYEVSYKNVVPASDMSSYKGGSSEELILYTCWPPDDIKQRYLVHAKPIETIALK